MNVYNTAKYTMKIVTWLPDFMNLLIRRNLEKRCLGSGCPAKRF